MAELNKVFLIGRLTRDPELRYTPGDKSTPVCRFGVAADRSYKVAGEKRSETVFVDVTVWGRLGEMCNKYLEKGKPIMVEGRLSFREWKDASGTRRTKLDITGENIQFMGSAKATQEKPYDQRQGEERKAGTHAYPHAEPPVKPTDDFTGAEFPPEDDLPF